MRKEIYRGIIEALAEVPEVRHIDLWNRQVEFLEEESPFEMPAVFVEFGQVDWQQLAGPGLCWDGRGTVILHIVTPWAGSAASASPDLEMNLAAWDIPEKIHGKLEGLFGDHFCRMTLSQTHTNHDHEDVVENIEVYRFKTERTLPKEE